MKKEKFVFQKKYVYRAIIAVLAFLLVKILGSRMDLKSEAGADKMNDVMQRGKDFNQRLIQEGQ